MAKKEKQKKQYDAKKHIQMTGSDRVMNGGFYLFITVFSIICLVSFRFLIYCRACIDTEWLQYLAV